MRRTTLLLAAVTCLTCIRASAEAKDPASKPVPEGKTVRVAGIVLKWIRTDKEANYRRAEAMIREAAKGGARIVCTTECFLDGYAIADKSIPLEKYRALGEPIPDGPYFKKLARLADELNIHLIAGMLEADGGDRFNTAVLIDPDGRLVGRYHKQRLGHESVRNRAGSESSVFATPFGKVGVMICADRRYPDVVGGFCQRGAGFLICPSGGMFGSKRNDPILQQRSRENRRYIVFVHPAEFLVTGPDGRIVQRTILGDRLLIDPEQVGTDIDSKRVFFFDLPLDASALAIPEKTDFDIVIRNGRIIDGTNRAAIRADVGIRDGRIVAVGDLKSKTAVQAIDASDRVVCPGFIDLHSHADRGILEFRAAENYIRQGVTTLLCGNCGSSPVDVKAFFERLRESGSGPNIALLIGHGSVRQQVMGRVNAAPAPEQLQEMKKLVREAMQNGASGLSTSLRYGPGSYATTSEIVELAKEVAPSGGFYATHMRDEGTRILSALDEALNIGHRAGIPVHISHHKISSTSVFGLTEHTLARIDRERSRGVDVTLDQYPYGAGSGGMSLYVPQWSMAGGLEAFRKRLKDPATRKRIVDGVRQLLVRKIYLAGEDASQAGPTLLALTRIQVARATHDPSLEGQSLKDILQSRRKPLTIENACELLIELISFGTRGINHTLDDGPGGDVERVMKHPQTCIASDGGVFEFGTGHPHPRSYGCYPRVLARYVREDKLLSLENAVHRMTALPAKRMNWTDRGVLKKRAWADVIVFDPDTVTDHATFFDPHQHSTGIEHVIVRGRFVLKNSKLTGELPGTPVTIGNRNQDTKADE